MNHDQNTQNKNKVLKIAILAGDGIGPEVMAEAEKILNALLMAEGIAYELRYADVGGIAIDKQGSALPETTLEVCRWSHAILFGSIGGPKWERLPPEEQPERAALLPLRKTFGLFANLRPAIVFRGLQDASPLKNEIIGNEFDILVVRELTGGIYFGQPKGREGSKAFDTLVYTEAEIRRIAHIAFQAARQRRSQLCSVDKANVLTSMVLWREVVESVGREYPDVSLRHLYVDNAAMQLLRDPKQFDVLLCGNMFGDIISDEASMISGSLGMLPSASLGKGNFGLYEPSGGSAPDIAGKGIANPIAQILSTAMMLKYSFGFSELANRIQGAVESVITKGLRTADIMSEGCKQLGTQEMGNAILDRLITSNR